MLLAGQISQPAGVSHLWEGAQHKSCPHETLPPAQRHHFGQKGFLFGFTIFHNTRKTLLPPQPYGVGHCTKRKRVNELN